MHALIYNMSYCSSIFFFVVYLIVANINNIPMLIGTNLAQWKEYVMVVLSCMDLDYIFKRDRPTLLTSTNIADQRVEFDK